jgi:predicted phosphodiesterase
MLFHANRRCVVTHGHLPLPALSAGDIVISGHTHVPLLEEQDGIIRFDPGSTTIPKSLSKPGYAVMDDTSITLKTLREGDIVKSRKL